MVSSCVLDEDAFEQLSQGDSAMKALLKAVPPPVSMIVGPDGELLAAPLVGAEGMVLADIDIARSIEQKMIHDIVGSYNRFDIFHLEIDRTPSRPVWINKPKQRAQDPSGQVMADQELDAASEMSETEGAQEATLPCSTSASLSPLPVASKSKHRPRTPNCAPVAFIASYKLRRSQR